MRFWRKFGLLTAIALAFCLSAFGQESQSLGDAARQARLQKQQREAQEKTAQGKDSEPKDATAQPSAPADKPAKKVVTNDDIPEHVGSTLTYSTTPNNSNPNYVRPNYHPASPADQMRAGILAQKNYLASVRREIDSLAQALEHPETCVADCRQRDQRLRYKEARLDSLKAQVDQLQKQLEDIQEAARKKGYGSSVYDSVANLAGVLLRGCHPQQVLVDSNLQTMPEPPPNSYSLNLPPHAKLLGYVLSGAPIAHSFRRRLYLEVDSQGNTRRRIRWRAH